MLSSHHLTQSVTRPIWRRGGVSFPIPSRTGDYRIFMRISMQKKRAECRLLATSGRPRQSHHRSGVYSEVAARMSGLSWVASLGMETTIAGKAAIHVPRSRQGSSSRYRSRVRRGYPRRGTAAAATDMATKIDLSAPVVILMMKYLPQDHG